jgi:hypothetical protein
LETAITNKVQKTQEGHDVCPGLRLLRSEKRKKYYVKYTENIAVAKKFWMDYNKSSIN